MPTEITGEVAEQPEVDGAVVAPTTRTLAGGVVAPPEVPGTVEGSE